MAILNKLRNFRDKLTLRQETNTQISNRIMYKNPAWMSLLLKKTKNQITCPSINCTSSQTIIKV